MASKELTTITGITPTAYYRFESGAFTTDSSGNSHTLTDLSDSAEVTGKFGGGAGLDSNDAFSAVNDADFRPTGDFTIGAWIKASSTGVRKTIFQSYSQNTDIAGIRLLISNGGYLDLISGKNNGTTEGVNYKSCVGDVSIDDNAWHFVVGTWDGAKLYVYVDGIEDTQEAWTDAPAYAATNYVRVGCRNNDGTNEEFLVGSIDDVFLLNGTALSGEEVLGIYTGWKTYNGTSNVNVKTINGVALASIATVKGI